MTSIFVGDVGGDGERLRGGGQVVDRALQVCAVAVDGDDARAALGEEADGRAADDAGSSGDDGNLAVQANTIRHLVSSAGPVVPDFLSSVIRENGYWFSEKIMLKQ